MKIEKFYVVTKPNTNSILDDILFLTDLDGLEKQFKGGLSAKEIEGVYTHLKEVFDVAKKLLEDKENNNE